MGALSHKKYVWVFSPVIRLYLIEESQIAHMFLVDGGFLCYISPLLWDEIKRVLCISIVFIFHIFVIVTTIFAHWFSIFIFLESLKGISVSCFVRYVSQWYIIPGLYICCWNMFASVQPKPEYYIDIWMFFIQCNVTKFLIYKTNVCTSNVHNNKVLGCILVV